MDKTQMLHRTVDQVRAEAKAEMDEAAKRTRAFLVLLLVWGNWVALIWAMLLGYASGGQAWFAFVIFLLIAVIATAAVTTNKAA